MKKVLILFLLLMMFSCKREEIKKVEKNEDISVTTFKEKRMSDFVNDTSIKVGDLDNLLLNNLSSQEYQAVKDYYKNEGGKHGFDTDWDTLTLQQIIDTQLKLK